MRTLLLVGISSLLLGSPAMSATYDVDGWATGLPQDDESSGATPDSVSGGDNGATFTANATNVGGGSVSVFASEGISDVTNYNNGSDNYYGIDGRALADVKYTIRVVGPTTGALIPVHINMTASAGSLDVPDPVGDYYAPVIAGAEAGVVLNYAEGDVPVGDPQLPYVVAGTSYDYRYFDGSGYSAPVLLGNSQTFDKEVMIEANFDVAVDVFASAGTQFTSAYARYTETAEGGASADPTFVIDEPGYSAYTIEGVPEGPAAAAAPEPATWAMMLLGFASVAFAGYRKTNGKLIVMVGRSGTPAARWSSASLKRIENIMERWVLGIAQACPRRYQPLRRAIERAASMASMRLRAPSPSASISLRLSSIARRAALSAASSSSPE